VVGAKRLTFIVVDMRFDGRRADWQPIMIPTTNNDFVSILFPT
jgi:hypothetical protein